MKNLKCFQNWHSYEGCTYLLLYENGIVWNLELEPTFKKQINLELWGVKQIGILTMNLTIKEHHYPLRFKITCFVNTPDNVINSLEERFQISSVSETL